MALENEAKERAGTIMVPVTKQKDRVILVLRLLAFCATASATIVMALNKETKSFVVPTVGNAPVKVTLTAKFQDSPAFVSFVIANGMATFHNLVTMGMDLFGGKLDFKGLRLVLNAIFDMLNTAGVSAAANAAAYVAELEKNGNKQAGFDKKICDKFGTFCDHRAGAVTASFIGLGLMLVISVISILKLRKPNKPINLSAVQP